MAIRPISELTKIVDDSQRNSFTKTIDVLFDICEKDLVNTAKIGKTRFTLNKDEINYANDEVLFFIDEKTATINIEELIYQAIELETPFVLYCPECAKIHENLLTEDEGIEESDMEE